MNWAGKTEEGVVTSIIDRQNEVSKMFLISLGNWIELRKQKGTKFTIRSAKSTNHRVLSNSERYINNSLHLLRKYARIFVSGHYLFLEAHSFPRASLEENCELRGTDNVRGQISEHIFAAKLRLLCLLSIGFKNLVLAGEYSPTWRV